MKVRYALRALIDLHRIRRYIAGDSSSAADRVFHDLVAACEALDAFPKRGRPGHVTGTRELVTVPPYIIIYVLSAQGVRVIRIRHGAEDR